MKVNKEIEFKVSLFSSSGRFYCIHYRTKKRFNLFNSWKMLFETWTQDGYIDRNHPILIQDFDKAVRMAKKFKENPFSIDEHYKKQDEIYKQEVARRKNYDEFRDKKVIL